MTILGMCPRGNYALQTITNSKFFGQFLDMNMSRTQENRESGQREEAAIPQAKNDAAASIRTLAKLVQ